MTLNGVIALRGGEREGKEKEGRRKAQERKRRKGQNPHIHTRDGPKFGRRRTFGRRIRPNVRLGSARQHVTIRPKFGRTSANIRRHLWLRICGALHSPLALRMSDCSLTTFRTQLKALLFI